LTIPTPAQGGLYDLKTDSPENPRQFGEARAATVSKRSCGWYSPSRMMPDRTSTRVPVGPLPENRLDERGGVRADALRPANEQFR
jgi:hypothetical protein